MNAISTTARSGLDAARLRLDAAAHNVANAQTAGFRRQVVTQATPAGGGVTAAVQPAAVPGDALADDLVQQMTASHAFKANLLVLRTGDRMLGSLLDVQA